MKEPQKKTTIIETDYCSKKYYGLIGYPLGHSFSRQYFTEKFKKEDIDAEYLNFEIPNVEMLLEVVRKNPCLQGLNCTIPYKRDIMPLLDFVSEEARQIGAVNVIKIKRKKEGEIHLGGYNTDLIGFTDSIKPLLSQKHINALILGTGGASNAISYGLTKLGLKSTCVSRSKHDGMLTYTDLNRENIHNFQVIVNCTPVGMFPNQNEAPNIPYEGLNTDHLLYDLIYNPAQTRFLDLGAQHGATTKNGLEMLHLQAEASWAIWQQDEE